MDSCGSFARSYGTAYHEATKCTKITKNTLYEELFVIFVTIVSS